jgi:branched-subunit amino acid ABC-type transport system permease component
MNSQLFYNVMVSSAHIGLVAVGFGLIYRMVGFFDFSYAAVYALSAYIAYAVSSYISSAVVGLISGVIAGIVIGCAIEIVIYRPLRKKGATHSIFLIASLGLLIMLQNVISIIFGDETLVPKVFPRIRVFPEIVGFHVTSPQLIMLMLAAFVLLFIAGFLKLNRRGVLMRAVAGDSFLAACIGIDIDRIILTAMLIGSSLAAISGVCWSYNTALNPNMGFSPLLLGMVAMIVGGMRNLIGIIIGAILVSSIQHLAIWYISSEWQDAIIFIVALGLLFLMPRGVLVKSGKETI